ncbi:Skp1-related protein [Caenorhabditis elegans]|uniref:Skp1-related protein n=2 Tax=Caenorhabditis elegans TaxID=6239 RepID=O62061_CAEEL|nr:Skp1-related protein [Caenorhabditis elegans]CAA19421.1 Skp1-related protein [Caenorhabditis elegans]|eukprot:NP_495948.1 Uncharacterized protein CELE_C16D2.1 [Caenorhabditis elegans]
MNFFQNYFRFSNTKLSTELGDVATPAVPSPIEATTAVCATPNQARRVIKTIDGQQLVLCANDVKYLSVVENMFANLNNLSSDASDEQFIVIPISIESKTMQKIIDWSRAAKKIDEKTLDFCQFFPNLTLKECIQILEASLFLETSYLGKCAAKWVASKLEGKSTGEMAQILEVAHVGLDPTSEQQLAQFRRVTL